MNDGTSADHKSRVENQRREVVVITGASAGVGRAVARAYGERKAKVALLARGLDGLWAAKREIEDRGGEALVLPTDVAYAEQVEAAAETVEDRFGPIDVWVNNAMVSVFSPVKDTTPEEYKRVTEVTYLGYVYGTLAALKRMRPRNRGVIVQVGSALTQRSIPLQSAYCAAKHAVQGFTESLRTELLHEKSGVRVTIVQLPALNTPQFAWVRSRLPREPQPVPPIFQPEVAARAVVWAADHPRRELYVGGSTVLAIFGERLCPGAGDRYLAKKGYGAQQTKALADPNRQDNVFAPLPGDYGAHGSFDARAHSRSVELWMATHRAWVFAVAMGTAAALVMALARKPARALFA